MVLATPIRKAFLLCSMLGFSVYPLLGLDDEDKNFVVTLALPQDVRMIRTAAQLTPIDLMKKSAVPPASSKASRP